MAENDSLIDIFILETNQLLEQLEEILLRSESDQNMSGEDINEIFRIMHTIKGSAAMMTFGNISTISHAIEDLFDFIRHSPEVDFTKVIDIVLNSLDFIKVEIDKIQDGKKADGDEKDLLKQIKSILNEFKKSDGEIVEEVEIAEEKKASSTTTTTNYIGFTEKEGSVGFQKYIAKIYFEDGCYMENIRAFSFIFTFKDVCGELFYRPYDLADDKLSSVYILNNGFDIYFSSDLEFSILHNMFEQILFVKSFELNAVESYDKEIADIKEFMFGKEEKKETQINNTSNKKVKITQQNFINVNITKLDTLLDLVGEIVISESMVTKNPDLEGLNIENFNRASMQLRRLLQELQDSVMSIRMVPMAETFNKMHRIVRDMGKKLNKDVELEINGEETEVDKNIINHLADPLMHIIRNSMDHGIEDTQVRVKKGKSSKGKISISAKNSGGEVVITVQDDGKGLDRKEILKKAKNKGLVNKADDELSDKDVFAYILHPGFSTKDEVTEFSGRGVGMDVVKENINKVGGGVIVESEKGKGMTVTIRIPLTLVIVDGMKIGVGKTIYTIPTLSVREFFKADKKDLVVDTQGNEMIMIRDECYPVLRLHKLFNVDTEVTNLCDGIMVMIEWDDKVLCLFADKLLGEQSVVAKPVPNYLTRFVKHDSCIGGCAILGDGNISLILDVKNIINQVI